MYDLQISPSEFGALAAEILESGHSLRFRARGASMRPFLRDGDLLHVQPVSLPAIRRGDVVLCRAGDHLVAHRVINIRREHGQFILIVQGDALAYPDGRIFPDQVLGRVVTVERDGRPIRMDTLLQRHLGLAWMTLAPFIRWLDHRWPALRAGLKKHFPRYMGSTQ